MEDPQKLSYNDPFPESKLFPVSAEVCNVILILIAIYQMYFGIEIGHPLYGILFINLILSFVSSILNISIFPFITTFKYSTLVYGNIVTYLVFYLSSWCVVSTLRYIYIIHNNWLHEKFPKAATLLILSSAGLILVFTLSYSALLLPLITLGWPYVKIFDMTTKNKFVCILTVIGTFLFLLGSSCIFYIAILRRRGKMGRNKVSALQVPEQGVKTLVVDELIIEAGNLLMNSSQSGILLQPSVSHNIEVLGDHATSKMIGECLTKSNVK
jgi:hypothetical protein